MSSPGAWVLLVFRLKKLTFAKTFAITTRPRALRPFFFIFTLGMDNMRLARRLSTTARSSRLSRPRTYLEKFEEKAAKHWRPEQVRSVTAGKDYALSPDKPGVPGVVIN